MLIQDTTDEKRDGDTVHLLYGWAAALLEKKKRACLCAHVFHDETIRRFWGEGGCGRNKHVGNSGSMSAWHRRCIFASFPSFPTPPVHLGWDRAGFSLFCTLYDFRDGAASWMGGLGLGPWERVLHGLFACFFFFYVWWSDMNGNGIACWIGLVGLGWVEFCPNLDRVGQSVAR